MVAELEIIKAFGALGLLALTLVPSAVGSGIGMLKAARAGVGVLSEEPRYFSSVLVLTFLPATQFLVYGSGFTLLMLNNFLLPGNLNLFQGIGFFALSIFVGLAELVSAYAQGSICADTIVMLPKTQGAVFAKGIILAAYLEFVGLLGLVFGYLFSSMLLS